VQSFDELYLQVLCRSGSTAMAASQCNRGRTAPTDSNLSENGIFDNYAKRRNPLRPSDQRERRPSAKRVVLA
jgi:hypothetical protein